MFAKEQAGYFPGETALNRGVMCFVRREFVEDGTIRGKTLETRRRVVKGLKKDSLAECSDPSEKGIFH